MKKLSLLLAVILLCSSFLALASCGRSDFASIKEEGKFVCGYTVYAPMNYWANPGTLVEGTVNQGDFVGFDTELAKLVAAKLGLEVEFVEIDWGQKYSELNSGAIDCIWNGFTSNSKDADGIERADKVDFTYAYLDNAQCVIVKADRLTSFTSAASLNGLKGAAEEGSAGESYAKSVTDASKVITKTSQNDTFQDLLSGAVDFVVVDVLLADQKVGTGNYASLAKVTAIDIDKEVYSIGCRKGSDFDEKINEALVALLNDGTLEALATKYNVHITDTLMAMKTAD